MIYDPFFLAGLPGKPELVQADGVHPDAAGVQVEVARILPLVLRLVSEVRPAAR